MSAKERFRCTKNVLKIYSSLHCYHCFRVYTTGAEQGILSSVEQVIGKMKNHETARISVKSRYGYGGAGNTAFNIPKDADLVYEVRVNNFTKVI